MHSSVKAAKHEEMAPLPKPRPKLVEPVAGQIADASAVESTGGVAAEPDTPKPTEAASGTLARKDAPSAINGGTRTATALDNGVALPPLEAPTQVLKIIEAGNAIARTPYKWGGGHGRFLDTGYDCSGSVSFALYAAGLIGGPSDSSGLMSWGKPGKGKWITIYANAGHVYMEVAGIRFDTSGAKATGSRWQNDLRTNARLRRPPPRRALVPDLLQAPLLEIEVALDRPHDLVGDLAGAAHAVDRVALGVDDGEHHAAPGGAAVLDRAVVDVVVEARGEALLAVAVDAAQAVDGVAPRPLLALEAVDPLERRLGGPQAGAGLLLEDVAVVGLDAEQADQPREREALQHERAEDHAEDRRTGSRGARSNGGAGVGHGGERERGGERDGAAHPHPGDDRDLAALQRPVDPGR